MEKQIIEGNKLIAEFMGMCESSPGVWQDMTQPSGVILILGDYTPHKDWNELMPVVQKIESLGFTVCIFSGCCDIESKTDRPNFEKIERGGGQPKILSTWQSCIDFIQWHNTQTPKQ